MLASFVKKRFKKIKVLIYILYYYQMIIMINIEEP